MILKQSNTNLAYFYSAALLAAAAAFAYYSSQYLEGAVESSLAVIALYFGLRGRGRIVLRGDSFKYIHRRKMVSIRYVDIAFAISSGRNLRFFFRNGSEFTLEAKFLSENDRLRGAMEIETRARQATLSEDSNRRPAQACLARSRERDSKRA